MSDRFPYRFPFPESGPHRTIQPPPGLRQQTQIAKTASRPVQLPPSLGQKPQVPERALRPVQLPPGLAPPDSGHQTHIGERHHTDCSPVARPAPVPRYAPESGPTDIGSASDYRTSQNQTPVSTVIALNDKVDARSSERIIDPRIFPRDKFLITHATEKLAVIAPEYSAMLDHEIEFQRELVKDLVERRNAYGGDVETHEKIIQRVNDYLETKNTRMQAGLVNEHHLDINLHDCMGWTQKQQQLLKAILQQKYKEYYGELDGLDQYVDECIKMEIMEWHMAIMKRRTYNIIRERASFIDLVEAVAKGYRRWPITPLPDYTWD